MRNMPTRETALDDFFKEWNPAKRTELIALDQAVGRITAKEYHSVNTLPFYRASTCDGVAVKSAAFTSGLPDTSQWIENADFARADTGDDFDDCYDTIIRIEDVTLENGKIAINPEVQFTAGMNVRSAGSTLRDGDFLIRTGLPIRPTDLAPLIMGGITMVEVYRKPLVAFIPTGSELIPAGVKPFRGKNVDTNSLMVKHQLIEMGAEPLIFPIVEDIPTDLSNALDKALEFADIVVINGGSSKGEEDFNEKLLEKKGTLIQHRIAAAPGMPMALAVINGKPTINLPGPTLAAFYGTDWCIRPAIDRFLNRPASKRETVSGVLTDEMTCPPHMDFLCRVEVTKGTDGYEIHPLPFKTVSMAKCLASNAMFISPVGCGTHKKGDILEVELLRGREFIEDSAVK